MFLCEDENAYPPVRFSPFIVPSGIASILTGNARTRSLRVSSSSFESPLTWYYVESIRNTKSTAFCIISPEGVKFGQICILMGTQNHKFYIGRQSDDKQLKGSRLKKIQVLNTSL